jgi:hypothetical protein
MPNATATSHDNAPSRRLTICIVIATVSGLVLVACAIFVSMRLRETYRMQHEISALQTELLALKEKQAAESTLDQEWRGWIQGILFEPVVPPRQPPPPPTLRIEAWMQNNVKELRERQTAAERRDMEFERRLKRAGIE